MIAGAAVPKAPQELRNGGNQRKVECFKCGASYYTSRYQIRQGTFHCRCGSGPMLASVLADCTELQPEMVEAHPLYAVEMIREDRRLERATGFGGVRHTFQCSACSKILASPEHLCSCGFQNSRSGGRYVEGSSHIVESRPTVDQVTLQSMMPSTRAERMAMGRAESVSAAMPF